MKQVTGLLCWLIVAGCSAATDEVDVKSLQTRLMAEIERDTRETAGYTGRSALHERVRTAMANVARHDFVDSHGPDAAYANRPLPIGHGQTISQPFIVALMTDLLEVEAEHVVLEIGTGSGYQAAVLATLVKQVYTIEIIPELAASARLRLADLGYENVSVKAGDGYFGWPEAAPFDAIIVTAVGPDIPASLVAQLKTGGRMVLPVGTQYTAQNLTVVTKQADGGFTTEEVLPVAFVPLTGDH
ncbi:MAG: protein-L-isoaspartate(D-aspartate) O-methyltransferase [Gammaproteobacteria bacterium]|nr:protein-L-isoaspartate(D-aspartate) O-methyltransferase [Gammaproteobacteria bacterium]